MKYPELSNEAAKRLLAEIFAPDDEIEMIPLTDEEIEEIERLCENPPKPSPEQKTRWERHRLEFLDMIRDDKENG